jgi:hypothetical protein
MAALRLSRLPKRMLCWVAVDAPRSGGSGSSSPPALVGAVPSATGTSSHRLRLLERQGLLVVGRTLGGTAADRSRTPAGRQTTMNLSGRYA